jgi:flagellar basal-body rod protein FlgC
MDLTKTNLIAAAGLRAQGERMRVIAENIANSDSTAAAPGADPYRRKTVLFASELDAATGLELVRIAGETFDKGQFERRFDPGHPSADSDGYVLLPNVNTMVEMTDMRQALRSYEANLAVIQVTKSMVQRTIDLLRG